MWETLVNGRQLNFRLAGINNQNFIMQDEETGSWWQQVTGEAIQGPLKGQRLRALEHDELSFGLWQREKPAGRVLQPDEQVARAGLYAPANWEERMAKVPVKTAYGTDAALEPRALVVGLTVNDKAKAYPFAAVLKQSPILDEVGGMPFLIVVGDDQRSVRAYERVIDGRKLEFFLKPGATTLRLVDAETGSEWDFAGQATSGLLMGRQLKKLAVLSDYWFDWKAYHPDTMLYQLGDR